MLGRHASAEKRPVYMEKRCLVLLYRLHSSYTLGSEPTFHTFPYKTWRAINHSRPQSLLEAGVRGPGGSGDTGFEVLESLSFTTKV